MSAPSARLGLRISGQRHAREAVQLAVAAEHSGIAEVWITEDYLERGIFAVAGAIAAATENVTIGLGVVNPFTRHPALSAMELGALNEIAGGRVIAAFGGSNERWMREWLGIDFRRPLAAVRETRQIVDELLGRGRVDHDGEHFRVHARMELDPAVRPPLWYGVKGPKGLAAARADADGVVLSVLSSPGYVDWVRRQVGPDVRLAAFVEVLVDPDGATARAAVRPFLAKFLGMHGDAPITREAGLSAEIAGRFRAALLAGEDASALVTDEMIDTFVIAGDAAACSAGMRRFAAAGLDVIVAGDRPELPGDAVVAALTACWQRAGAR